MFVSYFEFRNRNLKFTNNTCLLCDRYNFVYNFYNAYAQCVCSSVTHMLQISGKTEHIINGRLKYSFPSPQSRHYEKNSKNVRNPTFS